MQTAEHIHTACEPHITRKVHQLIEITSYVNLPTHTKDYLINKILKLQNCYLFRENPGILCRDWLPSGRLWRPEPTTSEQALQPHSPASEL